VIGAVDGDDANKVDEVEHFLELLEDVRSECGQLKSYRLSCLPGAVYAPRDSHAFASGSITFAPEKWPANASLETLRSRCARATVGIGTQTVLDPTIREGLHCSWDKVSDLLGPPYHYGWESKLIDLGHLERLIEESPELKWLGEVPSYEITLKPYRLNIYEQGGFFTSHRDSVTDEDTIGTLVVGFTHFQYTGGALCINTHDDHWVKVGEDGKLPKDAEPDADGRPQAWWAAFYTDCRHEVLPVTSGARVTASFRIQLEFRPDGSDFPPEEFVEVDATLRTAIADYLETEYAGESVGIVLDHEYPTQRLTHRKLRGHDVDLVREIEARFHNVELVPIKVFSSRMPGEETKFSVYSLDRLCPTLRHRGSIPFLYADTDPIQIDCQQGAEHTGNEALEEKFTYLAYAVVFDVPSDEDTRGAEQQQPSQ